MKILCMTGAMAALLWAGTARAQAASAADAPRVHERGEGTAHGSHEQARARVHETADLLRERARERMHEALAEHATLPSNAPELAAAAGAHRHERDREHLREAEAVRAAERHVARSRAGEAHHGHHDGGRFDPASRRGDGMGSGECTEAAGQHHLREMHGGSMDHTGGGDRMGGTGGHH